MLARTLQGSMHMEKEKPMQVAIVISEGQFVLTDLDSQRRASSVETEVVLGRGGVLPGCTRPQGSHHG